MGAPTIGFCRLPDGSTVAYGELGRGSPLVMLPGWLSHVQKSWSHPSAQSARDKLASAHRFIWYDRLGCGLSDRSGFTPSIDNDVQQLEAVLDAAGVERASLIGYSWGGPVAASFAARYPDRVDRLVLYSTYARGDALTSERAHEGFKALVRANWGLASIAMAAIFIPNGSRRDLTWFTRFQREATDADTAVVLLDALRRHDVRDALTRVRARRWCSRTVTTGSSRRSTRRRSRRWSVARPSTSSTATNTIPSVRDSGDVVEAILDFVACRPLSARHRSVPAPTQALSRREREVLGLVAAGEPNKAIARQLDIAVATVERHVASIYRKLGARGRADAAFAAVALGIVDVPAR